MEEVTHPTGMLRNTSVWAKTGAGKGDGEFKGQKSVANRGSWFARA